MTKELFESPENCTVEYTDVRITERNYDPKTKTLTLDVDYIRNMESEYVELAFNPKDGVK